MVYDFNITYVEVPTDIEGGQCERHREIDDRTAQIQARMGGEYFIVPSRLCLLSAPVEHTTAQAKREKERNYTYVCFKVLIRISQTGRAKLCPLSTATWLETQAIRHVPLITVIVIILNHVSVEERGNYTFTALMSESIDRQWLNLGNSSYNSLLILCSNYYQYYIQSFSSTRINDTLSNSKR